MDESRIRRKIQKALALASNNPSESEASTALLLAQKLMLEHGMSEGEFKASHRQEKVIIEKNATHKKKLFWYEKDMAQIIADNFRCYCFWRGRSYHNAIIFFGDESDVEIACDVYNYAMLYMNSLCDQFIKENQFIGGGARRDYRLGFLHGLRRRLAEQVQEYGLVLVKDQKVIEDYEEKSSNFTWHKSRRPSVNDIEQMICYSKGESDGKDFDYERKQVN